MKIKNIIVLILLIIGLLLVSACTHAPSLGTSVSVSTLSQKVEPIITGSISITQTTEPQTTATVTTQSTTVAITTPTIDPILHRYIKINSPTSAYEFTFYPSGVLNYREGTYKQVSGDYSIDAVTGEASGTWINEGNNKYLVQYLPVGTSGAQIVREYTLVPSHQDPEYPGITIAEHIKSTYETNALYKAQPIQIDRMYNYYPQRAIID